MREVGKQENVLIGFVSGGFVRTRVTELMFQVLTRKVFDTTSRGECLHAFGCLRDVSRLQCYRIILQSCSSPRNGRSGQYVELSTPLIQDVVKIEQVS